MTNTDFTTIVFKIVLMVISIAITYFVIPFLKELTEKYKESKIEKFIISSVTAAEQIIKGDKKGAEKKEKVLNMTVEWLKKHHIELTSEEIDAWIESMVYMMNHPEVIGK